MGFFFVIESIPGKKTNKSVDGAHVLSIKIVQNISESGKLMSAEVRNMISIRLAEISKCSIGHYMYMVSNRLNTARIV